MLKQYFSWLQKDNPTGEVDRYPQLDDKGQTSVKGIYVAGDLTGVPLLKLASVGGAQRVQQFAYDATFKDDRENKAADVLDVVIVGAGPAGLSAAIECEKRQLSYRILEAAQTLNTIRNFPKGKGVLIRPAEGEEGPLKMTDGSRETLIEELEDQYSKENLKLEKNFNVRDIKKKSGYIEVSAEDKNLKALRVILATGKSGNSRRLNVPGEDLEKVKDHLIDPLDYQGQKVLVVGGGDSAVESAMAMSAAGAEVSFSYRGKGLSRPKEENIKAFEGMVSEGKITAYWQSTVKEVKANEVVLNYQGTEKPIANDNVITLIGRELPLAFFKRCGILMEGEKSPFWYLKFTALMAFACMLYFGKSGWASPLISSEMSFGQKFINLLLAPLKANIDYSWGQWSPTANFLLGWASFWIFIPTGLYTLGRLFVERETYLDSKWKWIKTSYLTIIAVLYTLYFIKSNYMAGGTASWVESPTYWYSFFYCTTMVVFGIRRYQKKPTRYILLQTATLCFIQVFFLFLLPFHLYEPLKGLVGESSWFIREVLPSKWHAFALILFWPLNMAAFGTTTFWTWFPFVQSGAFLFFIIKHHGKGVYCGWICSCGGMAETLGDEYRTLAPHGPRAKKLENIGQYVLVFAFVVTFMNYFFKESGGNVGAVTSTLGYVYKLLIDTFFAGALGVGVYFFMGGRIWCRFGCPLAALMHIYTRFSRYRIFAEKKKCISCNICTKVCHMGIDVMNYANKGIPLNDAECVRCSACVVNCPMDVLAFGKVAESDPDNKSREVVPPDYNKDDWRAGLLEKKS